MNLTEREKTILQLAQQGLSDYKIARKLNTDPPSVTRSRQNATKKLLEVMKDLEWASRIGLSPHKLNLGKRSASTGRYQFYL